MLLAQIILFALAAVGGIALALLAFRRRGLPMGLALFHGLLAASGLGLLIASVAIPIAAATGPEAHAGAPQGTAWPVWSLGVFCTAVLGGLILFGGYHLRGKRLPRGLVALHALLAVAGFGLFLVWFAHAYH